MSTATIVLLALGGGTYLLKAAGPLVLGGRRLPASLEQVAVLTPAALLAALVVVSTLSDGRALTIDARAVGVAVAAAALWRRAPFVVVVVAAVVGTALVRAVTS